MADIEAWTDQAAELLKKRNWEGPITFLRVSSEVVKGKISNPDEVKKFTEQVRARLVVRSARARTARARKNNQAAAKRSAEQAAERYR